MESIRQRFDKRQFVTMDHKKRRKDKIEDIPEINTQFDDSDLFAESDTNNEYVFIAE